MKLCTPHAQKLRAAVTARGLDRFVAKTESDRAARAASRAATGYNAANFDPLVAAVNAINTNTIVHDPKLHAQDGPCPLCHLTELSAARGKRESFEGWIENAANDALKHAEKLGLVRTRVVGNKLVIEQVLH